MTSFNARVILLGLFVFCSSVRTNNIVDLIQTIRNKHANEQRSNDNSSNNESVLLASIEYFLLVIDFRNIIQTIQDHLYNTSAPSKFELIVR